MTERLQPSTLKGKVSLQLSTPRKNNSYEVTRVLKEQGLTVREFAEYLGKSPEQMSYWFKQGIDQSLENNIICFLAERKGVKLSINGIGFK